MIETCALCTCRYMNGAASNPDCHVFAFAGAQVKKGLEIAKKLQAENFGKISFHFIPQIPGVMRELFCTFTYFNYLLFS